MSEKISLDEAQEKFAKSSWNAIWPLLEKNDRTPSENEDLLVNAFTSLYHWKQIGTEVNHQRGYWMISKVYQVLEKAEPALAWAEKCARVTSEHAADMKDFDLAYAEEALARSYALAGELELAREHHRQASDLGERITDPDDKKIFQGDFEGGDWFGL